MVKKAAAKPAATRQRPVKKAVVKKAAIKPAVETPAAKPVAEVDQDEQLPREGRRRGIRLKVDNDSGIE